MLGIFAKDATAIAVKTRLAPRLGPDGARRFYLASLADTLETALAVHPHPRLFVESSDAPPFEALHAALRDAGLASGTWERLQLHAQVGGDLGARLESAFAVLCTHGGPALVVGSDSPSLSPHALRAALATIRDPGSADLVLGPTPDGGYWAIGLRRAVPGLLREVRWSTPDARADTEARAADCELRCAQLAAWTDVDVPEDLETLAAQIHAARRTGDARTARHVERALLALAPEVWSAPA